MLGEEYLVFIEVKYCFDMTFHVGSPFNYFFPLDDDLYDFYDIVSERLLFYLDLYNIKLKEVVHVEITLRRIVKLPFTEFRLDENSAQHISPIGTKFLLGVFSKTFRRNYTTKREADKKIIKRAVGNFVKGVIYNKFEGVNFRDYTILMNFVLNFDENIKISPQSISNIKFRQLPFKPLIMTWEVERFISYIKLTFPNFKSEWLFVKARGNMSISLYKPQILSLISINSSNINNIEKSSLGKSNSVNVDSSINPLKRKSRANFLIKTKSTLNDLYAVFIYYYTLYWSPNALAYMLLLYMLSTLLISNISLFMFNLYLSDIWVSDLGWKYYYNDVVNYKEPDMPGYIQPDVVTPDVIKDSTEKDVKLETKPFIRKCFAMLDFNNLTYYPSQFQPYNLPTVISTDNGIDNAIASNNTTTDVVLKVNISLDGSNPGIYNQSDVHSPTGLVPSDSSISIPSATPVVSVTPVVTETSVPSVTPIAPLTPVVSVTPPATLIPYDSPVNLPPTVDTPFTFQMPSDVEMVGISQHRISELVDILEANDVVRMEYISQIKAMEARLADNDLIMFN